MSCLLQEHLMPQFSQLLGAALLQGLSSLGVMVVDASVPMAPPVAMLSVAPPLKAGPGSVSM